MPPRSTPPSRYLIKSVVHASEVLCAFQLPGEVLRLKDVAERTGLRKAMCFRFLFTLHECGFLDKIEGCKMLLRAEPYVVAGVGYRLKKTSSVHRISYSVMGT